MELIVTDPVIAKRFWAKVIPAAADECWLWAAAKSADGYGQIVIHGKVLYAHRVAFQALRVEIPAGLQLDHLCRVRSCVNPWHLDPVTQRVNMIRGGLARRMTACGRGHEMTSENRLVKPDGRVACRACDRRRINCPECDDEVYARHVARHLKSRRCIDARTYLDREMS